MIYVSKSHIDQIEYLIRQSMQGNHVLFDNEVVRRVFWKDSESPYLSSFEDAELQVQDAYSVEHHIERLIMEPSLPQKRAYLEGLDAKTFERVVRTYFNIVENNLYESAEMRH